MKEVSPRRRASETSRDRKKKNDNKNYYGEGVVIMEMLWSEYVLFSFPTETVRSVRCVKALLLCS